MTAFDFVLCTRGEVHNFFLRHAAIMIWEDWADKNSRNMKQTSLLDNEERITDQDRQTPESVELDSSTIAGLASS